MPGPAPMKSVGLRIVAIMLFFFVLCIELLELLCFIVLLKSVDIIPIEIVLLFWFPPLLPTPVTWIVPDGFSAASIPLAFDSGECIPLPGFFFIVPFWSDPASTFVRPCGWYCVYSWALF